MNSKTQIKDFLAYQAYQIRILSVEMTTAAGSGHPTSCLSAADLVAALFFYGMHFDPDHFKNPNNDRFILSKGHAAPVLYIAWHLLGKVSTQELMTYRQIDSPIEGHPTARFAYAQAATGSLGMGLSIGAGMAFYGRMFGHPFKTFVLMGDSEVAEGSIWEAAELASFYKLNNLVGIIDCNRLGQSSQTMLDWHTTRYQERFQAFGWKTLVIDGHDMQQIMNALDKARQEQEQPVMIIAKTIKGYGIASVENKEGHHGKAFDKAQLPQVLAELKNRFAHDASYQGASFAWQPQIPAPQNSAEPKACIGLDFKDPLYKKDEMIATRKAFGMALASLGGQCGNVVSLDAEVNNSTYADLFAHKFPERFVQCFIAEQNMVSMGVGLAAQGAIPFISTFGAFFSRAADQIRMAAIGRSPLRLVGSHAGVSIGQDGPSQMALEDIALMRALPDSAVLYPCDAVSTHKLMGQMLEYNQGITYLRTTRSATPVIYDFYQEFVIGGCSVLRESSQDQVLVIAAGITVFEALKAYEKLQAQGITIAVIDLYSIKPLDEKTVARVATACSNKIVTVEDHYLEGGLGQAITYAMRNQAMRIECLAVKELMRSGEPQELMARAKIDAAAICAAVQALR